MPIPLPAFTALKTHAWAYPALETLHMVGIALLLGSLVLLDLRVWGKAPNIALAELAKLSLPVTVAGFLLAAVSGLLMFSTQPGELLSNRAFVVKMGLLVLAASNAAWFHARGSLAKADATAKALALASVSIWICTIVAGRWIAYV